MLIQGYELEEACQVMIGVRGLDTIQACVLLEVCWAPGSADGLGPERGR